MKYWAEFYHLRDGAYICGVGDRSVIRIDGRVSKFMKQIIAENECAKRGYDGYRLARGPLNRLFYLTAAVIDVRHNQLNHKELA